MYAPKAKTLDEIHFEHHTREEVILWLQRNAEQNPSYARLAEWLAESAEFDRCNHAVRVAVANAERSAERKAKDVTKEDGDFLPSNPFRNT